MRCERRHADLDDEEIRKYVLTAVAHHASKELRRRKRRPVSPLEGVHAVPDGGLTPDETAAKREDSQIARDVLSSLPPRRRAVMLLRYGWGLEPQQVCGLVKGLSPRAYRKEITRGVDELATKLRQVQSGEWCSDRSRFSRHTPPASLTTSNDCRRSCTCLTAGTAQTSSGDSVGTCTTSEAQRRFPLRQRPSATGVSRSWIARSISLIG